MEVVNESSSPSLEEVESQRSEAWGLGGGFEGKLSRLKGSEIGKSPPNFNMASSLSRIRLADAAARKSKGSPVGGRRGGGVKDRSRSGKTRETGEVGERGAELDVGDCQFNGREAGRLIDGVLPFGIQRP